MEPVERIVVELQRDATPISGRVCGGPGGPQPFTGWTDLFSVLQRMAAPTVPAIRSDEESPS
jgi:hypothetical protein